MKRTAQRETIKRGPHENKKNGHREGHSGESQQLPTQCHRPQNGERQSELIAQRDYPCTTRDLLHEGLVQQVQPRDLQEAMVVSEISTNYWKLGSAQEWEIASVRARREICRAVMAALTLQNSELDDEARVPLLDQSEDAFNRTSAGWECAELCIEMEQATDDSETSQHKVVRAIGSSGQSPQQMPRTREHLENALQGEGKARTAENRTTVKLGSSLDTIMQNEKMIRHDLYRAFDELRQLQRRELRRRG